MTVPPGLSPEVDAMENCVAEIEKELNVRVERLDILRDPAAEAVMAKLTQRAPPFLYNRESCQVVYSSPRSGKSSEKDIAPVVDKERVRAWAKGRLLPPQTDGSKVTTPVVLSQEDGSIDQEDLFLTDVQREGKEAIRQRTEEKAKSRQED